MKKNYCEELIVIKGMKKINGAQISFCLSEIAAGMEADSH